MRGVSRSNKSNMPLKPKNEKILLLIDGNALLHRAFHALPEMTDPKGRLVNAVYGFTSILIKVLKELEPEYIAATFDMAAPTFRHEEFKEYKAHRVKGPRELYNQMPLIKNVLNAFNIPIFEREGYEADDLIGTIAKKVKSEKLKVKSMIATGDLDTLQLVDKSTFVYTLKKGIKDTTIYDEKAIMARYGLRPNQLLDFKGLKGDPSDNIPGVSGVGEKTASSLVREYGNLENIYKKKNLEKIPERIRKKLEENKEIAFFSKKLVTIKLNVPVEFDLKKCFWREYDRNKVVKIFEELGFRSLVSRIPSDGSGVVSREIRPENSKNAIFQNEPSSILKDIDDLYKEKIFSQKIYDLEKRLVPAVMSMQEAGIRVDKERLGELSAKISEKMSGLEKKIFEITHANFNISSPQQLSEILFDKMKIGIKSLRKTPGGVISTAASELVKIKEAHPVISLILEYRELTKLKTTYTDALPNLINKESGRIHAAFHQLGTATGRFSSSDPNMQNIPVRGEMGKEIRKAFVAEEGYKLASFDYSQVELRIAASVAQDEKMIKAFQNGEDIHKLTAAEVNNVKLKDVTPEMRYQAKALNFGVLYGMSIQGFAESAGISRDKAGRFIQEYFEDFQGIASYVKNIKEHAKQFGFVETLWGRKRFLPNINSGDWRIRQSSERMAMNMPIQGTAADIIKMAMVEIYEKIMKDDGEIKMLAQVHDELLFGIRDEKTSRYILRIKEIMENVIKLAVVLKVDVKIGDNWKDMAPASY